MADILLVAGEGELDKEDVEHDAALRFAVALGPGELGTAGEGGLVLALGWEDGGRWLETGALSLWPLEFVG